MSSIFDQLTAKQETDAPSTVAAAAAGQFTGGDAPTSYTQRDIKEAVQELLKHGLLELARKPNLYRRVVAQAALVDRILEPLDLAMRIDDVRGLAFVVVAGAAFDDGEDEWTHPLVRRQRLNLEQSLLAAILRQQFVAHELEAGVGAGEAQVSLDDLLPLVQIYLGDPGSDAQEKKRLIALLEQLKGHGLVSDVDQHDRVTIRPIIAHLINPENLLGLLQALRKEVVADTGASPEAD